MSRRHKTSLSVCELENSDGNGGEKTGGVEAIELPLALRVAFVNLLAEGDEVGLVEVSISLVHNNLFVQTDCCCTTLCSTQIQ